MFMSGQLLTVWTFRGRLTGWFQFGNRLVGDGANMERAGQVGGSNKNGSGCPGGENAGREIEREKDSLQSHILSAS